MAHTKTSARKGARATTRKRTASNGSGPSRSSGSANKRSASSSKRRQGSKRSSTDRIRTTLSTTADKAKLPMAATGGAIAGLAGGVVLARRKSRNGMAKGLASTASQIGKAGDRLGQLASEVRRVREKVENK